MIPLQIDLTRGCDRGSPRRRSSRALQGAKRRT